MKLVLSILLLFSITLVGCKKQNVKSHKEFIGEWQSDNDSDEISTFRIGSDGKVEYQLLSGYASVTASGKFKLYNDILKVGVKKFSVNKYPVYVEDENKYEMEIEGITYFK